MSGVAAAGGASLLRAERAEAADGPLETMTVRFQKDGLCNSSIFYAAEEMLHAEGFTEIGYIEAGRSIRPVTHSEVDFSPAYANECVMRIMPVNR
jgi:NitT/TauT family transport system substrate-binding protein